MKNKIKCKSNLQEWRLLTYDNSVKILFSNNSKVSNSKIIIIKSKKPISLL